MSHWWFKAIADTIRRHGIWAGFKLTIIFFRGELRKHFGRHQKTITNLWFAAMFSAGVAIALYLRQHAAQSDTSADMLQGAILFAIAIALMIIPSGKLCLSGVFQQQLWLHCISACLFAIFLGACGYFFHDAWSQAYARNPASATLMTTMGCGVIVGFGNAIGWFFRSLIKPAHQCVDPSEIAGLTEEGRRRVCLHEAGHALCYGLCYGTPEDAAIGIDTDSFNIMMGVVNLPTPRDPTEVTKSYLEWQMLNLMAGSAAEKHFLGEESVCGSGDLMAMQTVATMYLMAGYGEAYQADAKEAIEVEVNRRAIDRLRQTVKVKAARLIELNEYLCRELANIIDQTEYVGCEQIAGLVNSVIFPEGIERLKWPSSIIVCQKNA